MSFRNWSWSTDFQLRYVTVCLGNPGDGDDNVNKTAKWSDLTDGSVRISFTVISPLISHKTSYPNISWIPAATKMVNFQWSYHPETGFSTSTLPRRLSNFRSIGQYHFARSHDKRSSRIEKKPLNCIPHDPNSGATTNINITKQKYIHKRCRNVQLIYPTTMALKPEYYCFLDQSECNQNDCSKDIEN